LLARIKHYEGEDMSESENEIKAGDRVLMTEAAPVSDVYPWVKAGAEGLVTAVHPTKDYPYSVVFEGTHVVDPHGCPVIVKDPTLLFDRSEITLKGDA
jgi:hypothetical protein